MVDQDGTPTNRLGVSSRLVSEGARLALRATTEEVTDVGDGVAVTGTRPSQHAAEEIAEITTTPAAEDTTEEVTRDRLLPRPRILR